MSWAEEEQVLEFITTQLCRTPCNSVPQPQTRTGLEAKEEASIEVILFSLLWTGNSDLHTGLAQPRRRNLVGCVFCDFQLPGARAGYCDQLLQNFTGMFASVLFWSSLHLGISSRILELPGRSIPLKFQQSDPDLLGRPFANPVTVRDESLYIYFGFCFLNQLCSEPFHH